MQQDLFASEPLPRRLDMPAVLERLADVSTRPRYAFMVLNLIARAGGASGRLGPYVREAGGAVPVRDWLCDALIPMAQRDSRRIALIAAVRSELAEAGTLPRDEAEAQAVIDAEVHARIRRSGRTNISRAVSELVKAGFVKRHYEGYRVDHHNRGAQRQAVYTVTEEARGALIGTA